MRGRGLRLLVLAAVLGAALGACSSSPHPARREVASTAEEPAAAPSAVQDGVRLTVTAVHLLPLAGEAGAQAARRLDLPVAELAQVHLLLSVRDEGPRPAALGGDRLELALAGRTLQPSTEETFPAEPLGPGEVLETAVGFDVPLREGAGAVLRWTRGGAVVDLAVGAAPVAG